MTVLIKYNNGYTGAAIRGKVKVENGDILLGKEEKKCYIYDPDNNRIVRLNIDNLAYYSELARPFDMTVDNDVNTWISEAFNKINLNDKYKNYNATTYASYENEQSTSNVNDILTTRAKDEVNKENDNNNILNFFDPDNSNPDKNLSLSPRGIQKLNESLLGAKFKGSSKDRTISIKETIIKFYDLQNYELTDEQFETLLDTIITFNYDISVTIKEKTMADPITNLIEYCQDKASKCFNKISKQFPQATPHINAKKCFNCFKEKLQDLKQLLMSAKTKAQSVIPSGMRSPIALCSQLGRHVKKL
jgi:hypothetical protein